MKKKGKNELSNNSKIIVLDKALGETIHIFLNIFLTAYFYKITQDNMIYISVYYIFSYIIATISAFLLGDYIKRKNKVLLYRCGTFFKAIFILLIALLKEKILKYIWLIGIIHGVVISTTGFPFNMIESEIVTENERTQYMSYKSAIGEITKIIVPIFLGAYITYTSYYITALLIFTFSIIKLIISCFIKNSNVRTNKMSLNKFIKAIKENPQYPIKKLLIIEFLKGITVHGVLSIVITLLIIYEVNSELDLGIWSSFFSICMIITMLIFAKKFDKHNSKKVLTVCTFSILISFALLLNSINMTTIVLYNIVYYIFIKMVLAITEIRLFDYANKPPFDTELNTEYFIFRELFLNSGRALGYIILLIIGFTHNFNYLKILFLFITIALLIIIKMSKDINTEEQNYNKLAQNPPSLE